MWTVTDVCCVRKYYLCYQHEVAIALCLPTIFIRSYSCAPESERVKVICLLVIMLLHKEVLQPRTGD